MISELSWLCTHLSTSLPHLEALLKIIFWKNLQYWCQSHCSEYLQQIQNKVHSVLGVRKSHVKQYLPGVVELTDLCNRKSCERVSYDIKSTWSVNISSVIHILSLESANLDWPFCCVLFSQHFSKILILW